MRHPVHAPMSAMGRTSANWLPAQRRADRTSREPAWAPNPYAMVELDKGINPYVQGRFFDLHPSCSEFCSSRVSSPRCTTSQPLAISWLWTVRTAPSDHPHIRSSRLLPQTSVFPLFLVGNPACSFVAVGEETIGDRLNIFKKFSPLQITCA